MLVAAASVWGANVVMIKVMATHFDAVHLAALRTVVAIAGIALVARALGFKFRRVVGADLWTLAAAAFLMVYAHQVLLTQGLTLSTATNGALALGLNPLLSVLLGALIFSERLGPAGLTGVGLGVAGAAIVILNRSGAQLRLQGVGDALLIASMLVYVCGGTLMRRLVGRVDAVTIAWMMHLIGGAMLVVHAAFQPRVWRIEGWTAPASMWVMLLASGLISTALGGLAWSYGIARLGLGRTSVFLNVLPLSALATAVVFLGEVVVPAHIAGFVLVLAGTWLANRKNSHESTPPPAGRRPAA